MRGSGIVWGCSAAILVAASLASGCSAGAGGRYSPSITTASTSRPRIAVETSATRWAGAVLRALPRRTDSRGLAFDEVSAIREAAALSALGVRSAGSPGERAGARYIASRLTSFGLEPHYQTFALPNGKRSLNVIVTIPGVSGERALLLGGHMDTKRPSPGANDNGSGCGVLLELASMLAESPPPYTVDIVFWGAEEASFGSPETHHLGSRSHAARLSASDRKRYAGVIVVDMVGVGTDFVVRTMGRGPMSLTRLMLSDARSARVDLSYLRDPGSSGWSDHEPYELMGMPVAWLEWREDPRYHTAGDTAVHLRPTPVRITGDFVTRFVYRLDGARIRTIDGR